MTKAIVIDKTDDQQNVTIKDVELPPLQDGDVAVEIAYSTMNYKDALAITGAMPVVRSFPMVPGIDFAGVVTESLHPEYKRGDRVILNGWGVGEGHWGGLAERAHVKGDWLVPMPEALTMRQAMIIGTAGYTAELCVMALEDGGLTPASGDIVVTGASGGVGSVALALLAQKGFRAIAVTGRESEADYLKSLGAADVISREEFTGKPRALNKIRFAGGIDTVGSNVLANMLSMVALRGTVAACGNAGGMDLPTSVAPFILRGVRLQGVDSAMCPRPERLKAWNDLAQNLDLKKLENMGTELTFDEVIDTAPKFLKGEVRGRVYVPINTALEGK